MIFLEGPFYSIDHLSELLNLHPVTLRNYCRERKIGAVKIGKSWLVPEHCLETFLEEHFSPPIRKPTEQERAEREERLRRRSESYLEVV